MPLTGKHQKQIIIAYCLIFYLALINKLLNGLLLFQVKPFLFNNRFDLFTWLLMKTSIHQWLVNNPSASIAFDVIFYSMPLLYCITFHTNRLLSSSIAISMAAFNFIYIQCYTLYPTVSIEVHIAWLLFPFLFIATGLTPFYFILQGLRYFFLFFFASAGIWKLVQSGVFNINQTSAVLLYQHKEYLTSSPNYWYTYFIYWLINHSQVSYLLYLSTTILELFFITGFFTKKSDRVFIACFIVFLLLDYLIMHISYWEVSPFLITLIYSKYSQPASAITSR